MDAINANGSVNRLIETLAGSAVLLAEPANATSAVFATPSPQAGVEADGASANGSASAGSNQAQSSIDLTQLLGAHDGSVADAPGSVLSSLGNPGSDGLPIVGNILGGEGLPIVGNVLGGDGLPIVGNVLGGDGLPIIGEVLGGDGLPIIGNVLGGHGLPVVGDMIEPGSTTVVGNSGLLQPVMNPVNDLIIDVHATMVTTAYDLGLGAIAANIVKLGESIGPGYIGVQPNDYGPSNLVTDVLNLPTTVLNGNIDSVLPSLGTDLTQAVFHGGNLVTEVLFGTDPSNPIPELIHGLGSSLQSLPLLTLDGGNTGNQVLGGLVGDLSHSSSGHLIDIDIGPEGSGGLPINILAANQSGPSHTLEVNAVDVGANGPHLLDLGIATGGSNAINAGGLVPSVGGADSLIGNVLGATGGSTAASPVATVAHVADVADLLPVLSVIDHGPLNLSGSHIL